MMTLLNQLLHVLDWDKLKWIRCGESPGFNGEKALVLMEERTAPGIQMVFGRTGSPLIPR